MRTPIDEISAGPIKDTRMDGLVRDVESYIDKLYNQQEKAGLDKDEYIDIMGHLDFLRRELWRKDQRIYTLEVCRASSDIRREGQLRLYKAIIVGLAVCVAVLWAGILICGG